MAYKRIVTKLLLRQDTAAHFYDVVPASGEPTYATDTHEFKIGDGQTAWQNLTSWGGSSITSVTIYRARSASGSLPPESGWVQEYIQGTKEAPWVWTRTTYGLQVGPDIQVFNPQYDASWQGYEFHGIESPVETTFRSAVTNSVWNLGDASDAAGSIKTSGVFTPQGTIEVK